MRCCTEDEGVALRSRSAGRGFKPPHAALAEDCCGERWGKGIRSRCQVGVGKASESESLMTCRKLEGDIRTGVSMRSRDELGGDQFTGQAVSGIQATRARPAAFVWNGRRRVRILPAQWQARGSVPNGPKP